MRQRRSSNYCSGHYAVIPAKPSTISTFFSKVKKGFVPTVVSCIPLLVSLYCFHIYYTQVAELEWGKLTYIAFAVTFLNALFGFPFFTEESYTDLKILIDYAQEILPLPCICTEIWIKHEVVENTFISYAHAFFGFTAFALLVLCEYKRMDLTDLSMIISTVSLSSVAAYYQNYAALAAALLCGCYYSIQKRTEECCLKHKFVFDYVMAAFNILALIAFEPKTYIPDFLKGLVDTSSNE